MKLIIDVKVQDLQRAVEFYTNKLGLKCRRQETEWAAVQVGDAEIHLYIHSGITTGLEFYVEDLEEKVKELKELGIQFFHDKNMPNFINVKDDITEFPWGRTAFFKDSEGNELAIVKDF